MLQFGATLFLPRWKVDRRTSATPGADRQRRLAHPRGRHRRLRRLTRNPFTTPTASAVATRTPNFSPDGRRITVRPHQAGNDEPAGPVRGAAGTELRTTPDRLRTPGTSRVKHDWAPDGKLHPPRPPTPTSSTRTQPANLVTIRPDGAGEDGAHPISQARRHERIRRLLVPRTANRLPFDSKQVGDRTSPSSVATAARSRPPKSASQHPRSSTGALATVID